MASISDLKQRIDLHDLADRLGLKRPGGKGNYMSPHHGDKSPSLSIFADGKAFKDFSAGDDPEAQGDCIAMVRWVEKISDVPSAMRRLHELFSIPNDPPPQQQERRERSREEFIADQCLRDGGRAVAYLRTRGIPEETSRWAVERKSVGFNDWTKPGAEPGTHGYGGPAVAFVIRDWASELPVAVDLRYIDPALNAGVKTKTTGQKDGVPWVACRRRFREARTVVVVESAINALVVEACGMPKTAALAIRGTGNASNIDWRICLGKRVLIATDADQPDKRGVRPGDHAAWEIYDRLTALNIAAVNVDRSGWYRDEFNDLADIAEKLGIDEVRQRLAQIEPWAIAGLPGRDGPEGRQRVFLPAHDYAFYWRFRVKEDFCSYITKVESDAEGDKGESFKFEDVAGFRIAALSRVTIQSSTATMSGEEDAQPVTVFATSVQVPRHGPKLLRRVFDDERLHNVEQWKKFGPVFSQTRFLRLVNILERTADCGARDAVNFVGLCWRNGVPTLNEGPDCYFTEPEKQCPYWNLSFPSGTPADARRVVNAYQSTFSNNAAAFLLCWALGAHLKAFLGFWPHLVMQADKGSGKSTLIKRLERSIGMTMFGGQSLQTEFRLLTSVSYTSHPIGWEEISARKQDVIDKAVAMLQENYQFTVTRRGSDMTEFLTCAPVLLAGEDVPVRSLTGKVVRTDLTGRMGPAMPEALPRFPVREWIQHLTTLDREKLAAQLAAAQEWCWESCRSSRSDKGASRMVQNYAAVAVAWRLLTNFAGIAVEQGGFLDDLRSEMNRHIKDTSGDRSPFVWILETLVSEIESAQFQHPYVIRTMDDETGKPRPVLIIRPQHVMDHIATTSRLKAQWDSLPVKSGRVFKRQLDQANLIVKDELDLRIRTKRHAHLSALSLDRMAEYGVFLSVPDDDAGNDTDFGRFAREASNT